MERCPALAERNSKRSINFPLPFDWRVICAWFALLSLESVEVYAIIVPHCDLSEFWIIDVLVKLRNKLNSLTRTFRSSLKTCIACLEASTSLNVIGGWALILFFLPRRARSSLTASSSSESPSEDAVSIIARDRFLITRIPAGAGLCRGPWMGRDRDLPG
jgi:hypothetical protein